MRPLWLAFFAAVTITCQATEPRVMRLFRNLEAGEKQTVVAYGTSLTHAGAWTAMTREWFETNYPGQVTFINSGGSGRNSDWGVSNLQAKVLDHHADFVMVEFSFNDAHTKFAMSAEHAWTNLSTIVQGIREQNAKLIEQQQATLKTLEEMEKTSTQLKFFGKRS